MEEFIYHHHLGWAYCHQYGDWKWIDGWDGRALEWYHDCAENGVGSLARQVIETQSKRTIALYLCSCGSRFVETTGDPNYPQGAVEAAFESMGSLMRLMQQGDNQ